MAARLDHPNIVQIFDVGDLAVEEPAGGIFIASAYCREGTLARWIERQGVVIPPRVSARLMTGIAEGVQYLHDLGISTGLKPSNVLLHPAPRGFGVLDADAGRQALRKRRGLESETGTGSGSRVGLAPPLGAGAGLHPARLGFRPAPAWWTSRSSTR